MTDHKPTVSHWHPVRALVGRAALAALVALVLATGRADAAGARLWTDEGAEFLKGTHTGTALTADQWLVLAGQRNVLLEPSPTRFVWDLALDRHGSLYIATGNRGKLLRLRRDPETGSDTVDEFYDFTDPVIFSLALDAQDNLYAATSPGGVVYKLVPQAEGKPLVSIFYDTDGQYVWDMVVGSQGQLYLATGPDGLPLAGLRVEGERTGHAHVLPGEIYGTPDARRVVRVHEPTLITHEEHKHLVVPEGWWEVRIQREWWRSPTGNRTVPRWD